MWRALYDRVQGRPVEHDLGSYRRTVAEIGALEPALAALGDDALLGRARALRAAAADADAPRPTPAVVEAFALAREAARRALGQRPFDEQLIAGLALARGRVGEMATGEG
jgi:preprotein translocase subunit SecA